MKVTLVSIIAATPVGCSLTLTHEMDPAWTTILEGLARTLENGNG